MRYLKGILSLTLILVMVFTLSSLAFAESVEVVPNGGLKLEDRLKSNEEVFEEVLNDPTLSAEAKQKFADKIALVEELMNSESYGLNSSRSYEGEEYALNVTAIKQEKSNYCSAAVCQQTLKYLGGTYDDQRTIYEDEFNSSADTSKVIKYINARQTKNTYIRFEFSGQTELDNIVLACYRLKVPIIYTVKVSEAARDRGVWPYSTNGHFTNLCGYVATHEYMFADPYYFPEYVASSEGANGIHFETYDNMITANSGYGYSSNYLSF